MNTLYVLVGAVLFLQLVTLFMLMNKKEGFKSGSGNKYDMGGHPCIKANCLKNPNSKECKECPGYSGWVAAGKPKN